MFEFRYDIPAPVASSRSGRKPSYPWAQLPVGASVYVPGNVERMRVSLAMHKSRHPGTDFEWDRELDGIRVWRTA